MSHLDQAFIRAFAKNSRLPAAASPTRQRSVESSASAPAVVAKQSPLGPEPPLAESAAPTPNWPEFGTTYLVDELCPAGTWHRIEAPIPSQSELVIPPPHIAFQPAAFVSPLTPDWPAVEPPSPPPTTRIDEPQGRGLPSPHFRLKLVPESLEEPADRRVEANDTTAADSESASPESPELQPSDNTIRAGALAIAADVVEEREQRLLGALPAKDKFSPMWEVDRFLWPATCEQALLAANEFYRDAGVRLRVAARDGMCVLAITSANRGEGRTTVALTLARSAAAAGARVALVDADLDRAQLSRTLGVEASSGWEAVVVGDLPLAEAAVVSLEDRIVLLPLGGEPSQREFSLEDTSVSWLLHQIADQFDLVIVDAPAWSTTERRMFEAGPGCPIDAALVVRDVRHTSEEQALTTATHLRASGIQSVGVVENFVPRGSWHRTSAATKSD